MKNNAPDSLIRGMNFIDHQNMHKAISRRLIVLYALAYGFFSLLPALAVGLLLAMILPFVTSSGQSNESAMLIGGAVGMFILLILLLFSWGRSRQLRDGGQLLLASLRATPLATKRINPLQKRLLNVTEEIAVAAGIPVPSLYVLEREIGINALTIGYGIDDAAIVVSRGALEALDRRELQAVVAHEVAHIVHGDTGLNIQMVGALFGLVTIRQAGLAAMRDTHPGIIALGAMITAIGMTGVWLSRGIKASVSRQREQLADAAAIRFTRDPEALASVLIKVAALRSGPHLAADTEQVGHMLFAGVLPQGIFATHPPLYDRIRKLKPTFHPNILISVERNLLAEINRNRALAATAGATAKQTEMPSREASTVTEMMAHLGHPVLGHVVMAANLIERIPPLMQDAARTGSRVLPLLAFLVANQGARSTEKPQRDIEAGFGSSALRWARDFQRVLPAGLELPCYLPLLEIAAPALRERSFEDRRHFDAWLKKLLAEDDTRDPIKIALADLMLRQLQDLRAPRFAARPGEERLAQHELATLQVMRVVAEHGHRQPEQSIRALNAGLSKLGMQTLSELVVTEHWPRHFRAATEQLHRLTMQDKSRLIDALLTVIADDGRIRSVEASLVRLIAARLKLPLAPVAQIT
ncbi:MAG: M48 family metalloprotease [Alcanivoracaceae bacterium]